MPFYLILWLYSQMFQPMPVAPQHAHWIPAPAIQQAPQGEYWVAPTRPVAQPQMTPPGFCINIAPGVGVCA